MKVHNPVAGLGLSAARVTLSAAQIRALTTTPATLVPAQGANKVIVPMAISLQGIFGTIPFTGGVQATTGSIDFDIGSTVLFTYTDNQTNGAYVWPAVIGLTTGKSLVTLPPVIFDAALTQPNINSINDLWFGPQQTTNPGALANLPLTVTTNTASQTNYNSGPIVTAVVTPADGGVGYLLGDTGIIDPAFTDSTGDATYTVTGVTGTAVTAISFTPGTSYAIAPAYPTGTGGGQPGIGTGLTVDVTAVTAGDGTAVITVFYVVVLLS